MSYEGPVQIIGVDAKNNAVVFNKEQLAFVLSSAPPDMKVAVVSVVGAFRTGKSFLLDLFLRYLRAGASPAPRADWMKAGGEQLEGNVAMGSPEFHRVEEGGAPPGAYAGFKWRAGNERQTLGVWMWNKPFILPLPGRGEEKVAVLLMDTQGLFDTQTNQALTAQIFGLSTLISSYQVYNVMNRVGEDILGNVATFSAYARTAADYGGGASLSSGSRGGSGGSGVGLPRAAAAAAGGGAGGGGGSVREVGRGAAAEGPPPIFQRLEFLVRDFHMEAPNIWDDAPRAEEEMGKYFNSLFDQGGVRAMEENKGLREARSQILTCFSAVSGFCLPSPGEVVAGHADATFTGRISDIRPKFCAAVERYARIVFTQQLAAKRFFLGDGDEVTASEFEAFVTACCTVFQDSMGEGHLPVIGDLLTVTRNAHTRCAKELALKYMHDIVAPYQGEAAVYADPAVLGEALEAALAHAEQLFDKKANFGNTSFSRELISGTREALQAELRALVTSTCAANKAREPHVNLYVLLPLLWVLATLLHTALSFTCAPWLSLCSSLASTTNLVRTLLLLLIPYAVYMGDIPAFISGWLLELATLARANSAGLPQPVQDFLHGPLLWGVKGGGGGGGCSPGITSPGRHDVRGCGCCLLAHARGGQPQKRQCSSSSCCCCSGCCAARRGRQRRGWRWRCSARGWRWRCSARLPPLQWGLPPPQEGTHAHLGAVLAWNTVKHTRTKYAIPFVLLFAVARAVYTLGTQMRSLSQARRNASAAVNFSGRPSSTSAADHCLALRCPRERRGPLPPSAAPAAAGGGSICWDSGSS